MANHKGVSIIIPFNGRIPLLLKAIESVRNQTYAYWELILVNDGKDTIDLPNLGDHKVILLNNSQNFGPGASRQRGLGMACGEYICFLDSDDQYQPHFLEYMVNEHERNENLSFVYCTSVWIDSKGHQAGIYKNSDCPFYCIMPALLLNNRPWNTSSLMWNRKKLPDWSLLFRTWEDYLFEFQASKINNAISHVNHTLCFIYKDRGTGLSVYSEKPIGIAHRSHVLQIMLHEYDNQDGAVKNEILKRIKKDSIKAGRRLGFNCTSLRIFLGVRSYTVLGRILPVKIHWILYRALLKSRFGRKLYSKTNIL